MLFLVQMASHWHYKERSSRKRRRLISLICLLRTAVFRINFQNGAVAHTMVSECCSLRINAESTITALWATHFTFSLSRFSISMENSINHSVRAGVPCASQRFTEGRFPWLPRLSCKSSFGKEHLHPLQWPLATPRSLPDCEMLCDQKDHNNIVLFPSHSCLAWTRTWSQPWKSREINWAFW